MNGHSIGFCVARVSFGLPVATFQIVTAIGPASATTIWWPSGLKPTSFTVRLPPYRTTTYPSRRGFQRTTRPLVCTPATSGHVPDSRAPIIDRRARTRCPASIPPPPAARSCRCSCSTPLDADRGRRARPGVRIEHRAVGALPGRVPPGPLEVVDHSQRSRVRHDQTSLLSGIEPSSADTEDVSLGEARYAVRASPCQTRASPSPPPVTM